MTSEDGGPKPTYWCHTLLINGEPEYGVRIAVGPDSRIASLTIGCAARLHDVLLGTVLPGMANAHSHAFHRALRGRTNANGGDFWQWREAMYRAAGRLDPGRYYALARAVFAEMLVSGWTAVGEFHYVHHRPDGSPYPREHAMELALAAAARDVGIRLVLLDTIYLTGAIGRPLAPEQRAFGDGSATRWLARWRSLQVALGVDAEARVTLGAAIHSVRAVPRTAMAEVFTGLPPHTPVHIHLSEQPQENVECLAEYSLTPTGVLAELGALSPRLSVVHATHLSAEDITMIGSAGATVVLCPTTEADLGDGIGPARRLADAGATLALGSDQNVVVDPLLEMRGLEAGERLTSGQRGCFDPAALLAAVSHAGYASLGLGDSTPRVGGFCDLVEISTNSVRTVGSAVGQLPLTATASDVQRVIVHGVIVANAGRLISADGAMKDRLPEDLLRVALDDLYSDLPLHWEAAHD